MDTKIDGSSSYVCNKTEKGRGYLVRSMIEAIT